MRSLPFIIQILPLRVEYVVDGAREVLSHVGVLGVLHQTSLLRGKPFGLDRGAVCAVGALQGAPVEGRVLLIDTPNLFLKQFLFSFRVSRRRVGELV